MLYVHFHQHIIEVLLTRAIIVMITEKVFHEKSFEEKTLPEYKEEINIDSTTQIMMVVFLFTPGYIQVVMFYRLFSPITIDSRPKLFSNRQIDTVVFPCTTGA